MGGAELDELPPLTPRVRRSLGRAREIAREYGQDVVGTEHLLLAFLDDRNGVAGMAMHGLGAADALRAEIVRIISSPGYSSAETAPRQTPGE
jgi:ATP-dependent Clp protease ATP-binding subunit ClpA